MPAPTALAAIYGWGPATKVDAILIAPQTGFAVLFEAKVLADASSGIGFDVLRNQLERSCFVLLTPEIFRDHPQAACTAG